MGMDGSLNGVKYRALYGAYDYSKTGAVTVGGLILALFSKAILCSDEDSNDGNVDINVFSVHGLVHSSCNIPFWRAA